MVQSELHPADERREVDGNPGEPHADAAPAGVPEVVGELDRPADSLALHTEPDRPADSLALYIEPDPADSLAIRPDAVEGIDGARAFQASEPPALLPPQPLPVPADDLRLSSPGIRLSQVKEELVAWVKTLMSAAVYAVLIVTFGFQVARVEGQSMAPTLEDQDRLIVNKLVYRIGEPRRGDIVMLYYPLNPDKSFVKRVIAEEGDTVRIVDGRVYVNDIPLKDDYVASEYRSHDDWGPQVIPEGYYFVMGDHRNNSSDSRHWGMVPKKYIIGKVQLRWWPVPTARVF